MAAVRLDSVAALLDAMRQFRLLEAEQFEEIESAIGPRYPDPLGLAKELVRRGMVTPFQVNQLFQGNGRELVLGNYILLERIGEGGMGTVYKARHRMFARLVALKLLRKDRLANVAAVKRFEREIKASAQLAHPNVVTAYDAGQIGDMHFYTMEYVQGIDLGKMCKDQGPLPIADACEYIRQAACGLGHAHEKGMVHRDLKPSNLLLSTKDSVIKILDLGLARLEETDSTQPADNLTKEGKVVGTVDYLAPEQAVNSHRVDIRADLYSLGCTLYQLLAGRVPFKNGSALEKLSRHRWEEPKPVETFRSEVPVPVSALVRKLMAKKPEDRYQTPAELASALAALGGRGSHPRIGLPVALSVSAPVAQLVLGDVPTAAPVAMPAGPADGSVPVAEVVGSHVTGRLPLALPANRRNLFVLAGIGLAILFIGIVLTVLLVARLARNVDSRPRTPRSAFVPRSPIETQCVHCSQSAPIDSVNALAMCPTLSLAERAL